jgi:hypothetical protein
MDLNHLAWNENQQSLQDALAHPDNHPEWLRLFLRQHLQVHSRRVAEQGQWSFEDEVLEGLTDSALRVIPANGQHSIAWILWHLARIEDLTMNMLIAGADQLFVREGWAEKLKAPIRDTGNEIDKEHVKLLSQTINLESLRAYRVSVGQRTRTIVSSLPMEILGQKVDPKRIQDVRLSGDVIPAAEGIVNYWSRRTVAGLLLMPPTRHCFTHLNEALRIKKSLER